LEQIRLELLDGISLAEFHRLLMGTDDYDVSYAGVRNYHTIRKAPADYYARVSEVFGIRLEWLLFGRGEMLSTPSEESKSASEGSEWMRSLPKAAPTAWDPTDPISKAAFLDCIRRLELARPGTLPLEDDERIGLARVLDTLVAGTLWILRGDRQVPRRSVRSILLALGESLPGPKQGSSYQGILKRMKMDAGRSR